MKRSVDICRRSKMSVEIGERSGEKGERSVWTGKDQLGRGEVHFILRKIIGDGERSRSVEKNKGQWIIGSKKDHLGRGSIRPQDQSGKGKDQSGRR